MKTVSYSIKSESLFNAVKLADLRVGCIKTTLLNALLFCHLCAETKGGVGHYRGNSGLGRIDLVTSTH